MRHTKEKMTIARAVNGFISVAPLELIIHRYSSLISILSCKDTLIFKPGSTKRQRAIDSGE